MRKKNMQMSLYDIYTSVPAWKKVTVSVHAIPRYRVRVERIVTTLTPAMVSDIMEDEPDSLVDRRDKAVCLLALHVGLRSCDIRNLKFGDIDWDKSILTILQQKTNVPLQMPLEKGT